MSDAEDERVGDEKSQDRESGREEDSCQNARSTTWLRRGSKPLGSRVRMNALQIFPETVASGAGGTGSRMIGPVRDSPRELLASGA